MSVEAHGSTARKLETLLMDTGGLADLLQEQDVRTWAELAKKLRTAFEQYLETLEGDTRAGYTEDLCTAYYAFGKPVRIKDGFIGKNIDGTSKAAVGPMTSMVCWQR